MFSRLKKVFGWIFFYWQKTLVFCLNPTPKNNFSHNTYCFSPHRALILWALCLFPDIYLLFVKLKSQSQRLQLEKCCASECIHFNSREGSPECCRRVLLKMLLCLQLGLIGFLSASANSSLKKGRILLLWAANFSQVYILMCFFWSTYRKASFWRIFEVITHSSKLLVFTLHHWFFKEYHGFIDNLFFKVTIL